MSTVHTETAFPADLIIGTGFTQCLNAALLASRGFDLRSDIIEATSGNTGMLADTIAVQDLIVRHGLGLKDRDDLHDLVGAELCDARGVEFKPGDRFITQEVAVAILQAWLT